MSKMCTPITQHRNAQIMAFVHQDVVLVFAQLIYLHSPSWLCYVTNLFVFCVFSGLARCCTLLTTILPAVFKSNSFSVKSTTIKIWSCQKSCLKRWTCHLSQQGHYNHKVLMIQTETKGYLCLTTSLLPCGCLSLSLIEHYTPASLRFSFESFMLSL